MLTPKIRLNIETSFKPLGQTVQVGTVFRQTQFLPANRGSGLLNVSSQPDSALGDGVDKQVKTIQIFTKNSTDKEKSAQSVLTINQAHFAFFQYLIQFEQANGG